MMTNFAVTESGPSFFMLSTITPSELQRVLSARGAVDSVVRRFILGPSGRKTGNARSNSRYSPQKTLRLRKNGTAHDSRHG